MLGNKKVTFKQLLLTHVINNFSLDTLKNINHSVVRRTYLEVKYNRDNLVNLRIIKEITIPKIRRFYLFEEGEEELKQLALLKIVNGNKLVLVNWKDPNNFIREYKLPFENVVQFMIYSLVYFIGYYKKGHFVLKGETCLLLFDYLSENPVRIFEHKQRIRSCSPLPKFKDMKYFAFGDIKGHVYTINLQSFTPKKISSVLHYHNDGCSFLEYIDDIPNYSLLLSSPQFELVTTFPISFQAPRIYLWDLSGKIVNHVRTFHVKDDLYSLKYYKNGLFYFISVADIYIFSINGGFIRKLECPYLDNTYCIRVFDLDYFLFPNVSFYPKYKLKGYVKLDMKNLTVDNEYEPTSSQSLLSRFSSIGFRVKSNFIVGLNTTGEDENYTFTIMSY